VDTPNPGPDFPGPPPAVPAPTDPVPAVPAFAGPVPAVPAFAGPVPAVPAFAGPVPAVPAFAGIAPPVFPQDLPTGGPGTGAQAGVALLLAVAVTLLGFPLGALWSAVAPHTPAVVQSDGAYLADPEGEHRIADEGWYLVLAIAAGIAVTVLAWTLLRRYRGPLMLLGLALGGAGGGVLTWSFGRSLGRAHARELALHAPVGTHFGLPVDLRAMRVGLWHGWLPYAFGDVLAIAFTVVLLTLLLAGFSPYPALRPVPVPPDVPVPLPRLYPAPAGRVEDQPGRGEAGPAARPGPIGSSW